MRWSWYDFDSQFAETKQEREERWRKKRAEKNKNGKPGHHAERSEPGPVHQEVIRDSE